MRTKKISRRRLHQKSTLESFKAWRRPPHRITLPKFSSSYHVDPRNSPEKILHFYSKLLRSLERYLKLGVPDSWYAFRIFPSRIMTEDLSENR